MTLIYARAEEKSDEALVTERLLNKMCYMHILIMNCLKKQSFIKSGLKLSTIG